MINLSSYGKPILTLLACAMTMLMAGQEDEGLGGIVRPDTYPAKWGQYEVRSFGGARQVSILRLGAGPRRKAEYFVFDWVNGGERLRPLYKTELRNGLVPLTWKAIGHSRFLVTIDDQFELRGSTDNAIVAYDLARGESKAFRVEQFLPEKWLLEQQRNWMWCSGRPSIDQELLQMYPNRLDRAHNDRGAWLVIDLPSLSVEAPDITPATLPERAELETSIRQLWSWSYQNTTTDEVPWGNRFALPTFLNAKRDEGTESSDLFVGKATELTFKLDLETGDYVRCATEDWPQNR